MNGGFALLGVIGISVFYSLLSVDGIYIFHFHDEPHRAKLASRKLFANCVDFIIVYIDFCL